MAGVWQGFMRLLKGEPVFQAGEDGEKSNDKAVSQQPSPHRDPMPRPQELPPKDPLPKPQELPPHDPLPKPQPLPPNDPLPHPNDKA